MSFCIVHSKSQTAAMLRRVCNGIQTNLHYLRFRSLLLYSTASKSSEDQPPHLVVQYLEHSLGFSRESAVMAAASKKVSRLKSPENLNSVINIFRQLGITESQIKSIVSFNTGLLRITVKTLAPKIRVLHDLGLSGPELGAVLVSRASVLTRGLDTHINPMLEVLRSILGSDENVVKAIKRCFILISTNVPKRIHGNLKLLKSHGLSDERIRKLVLRHPRNLVCEPGKLELNLKAVEGKIGIPRHSRMFIYGIDVLMACSEQNIESKLQVFKSYGFTQQDITTMLRNLPHILKLSETKLKAGLDFYMKEIGCDPIYMASHANLLNYSLENRVLPRMALWEALKEKKLIKTKYGIYSVLNIPDVIFMKKYVMPYKDELPELCEACIKKTSSIAIVQSKGPPVKK